MKRVRQIDLECLFTALVWPDGAVLISQVCTCVLAKGLLAYIRSTPPPSSFFLPGPPLGLKLPYQLTTLRTYVRLQMLLDKAPETYYDTTCALKHAPAVYQKKKYVHMYVCMHDDSEQQQHLSRVSRRDRSCLHSHLHATCCTYVGATAPHCTAETV